LCLVTILFFLWVRIYCIHAPVSPPQPD
jgi:hypothetical protein